MADDNRLDFDSFDDIGTVKKNLLEDVAAVKDMKEKQKAKETQEKTSAKNKTLMLVVTVVAAVVIFGAAYWWVFVKNAEPKVPVNASKTPTSVPAPMYRATPTTPTTSTTSTRPSTPATSGTPGYSQPKQTAPQSAPVQRNGSDTYDDGPSTPGM